MLIEKNSLISEESVLAKTMGQYFTISQKTDSRKIYPIKKFRRYH